MKKLLKRLTAAFFILSIMAALSAPALAQDKPGLGDAFGKVLTDTAGEAGYDTAPKSDLISAASDVIYIILYLLGIIFLAMILYSGIRWMTAGGNEQSIDRAKGTIKQAIIGLIIVVGAYALSYFFIEISTASSSKYL